MAHRHEEQPGPQTNSKLKIIYSMYQQQATPNHADQPRPKLLSNKPLEQVRCQTISALTSLRSKYETCRERIEQSTYLRSKCPVTREWIGIIDRRLQLLVNEAAKMDAQEIECVKNFVTFDDREVARLIGNEAESIRDLYSRHIANVSSDPAKVFQVYKPGVTYDIKIQVTLRTACQNALTALKRHRDAKRAEVIAKTSSPLQIPIPTPKPSPAPSTYSKSSGRKQLPTPSPTPSDLSKSSGSRKPSDSKGGMQLSSGKGKILF